VAAWLCYGRLLTSVSSLSQKFGESWTRSRTRIVVCRREVFSPTHPPSLPFSVVARAIKAT
jgi:hypothetical protein